MSSALAQTKQFHKYVYKTDELYALEFLNKYLIIVRIKLDDRLQIYFNVVKSQSCSLPLTDFLYKSIYF
jgi:hypothetical protein